MIALIDQYQKELLKVNGFAASTVETYTISIKAFCSFARNQLEMNPVKVKGPQLLKWILYLKNTGIGHSRLENHHYALKSFFAFLQKTGDNTLNPAQALPLLSDIQVMMGHDSIADTSIYIHVSDKLKQMALDSIQISRRFSWQ